MKPRMCAYGNCENDDVVVTVNLRNQERPAFCCIAHATLWLMKRLPPRRDPEFLASVGKLLAEKEYLS